jgi:hypothetical protein
MVTKQIDRQRRPYRVAEVARRWGVSTKVVTDAIKRGKLLAFRPSRVWLIPPESVERVESGEAATAP